MIRRFMTATSGSSPNGGIKQFTYGNGLVHTMTQNARQLPARSVDSGGILDLSYAYDSHANVTGITDATAGARQSRSMIYDGFDRLRQTTGVSFTAAAYTYDALDNLKTLNVTGGVAPRNHTYLYDATNRLSSVINTVGGATVIGLGYDPQGNMENKNGQAYRFDYGNRLRQVDGKGNYLYDGHGRRARDVVNGVAKHSQYLANGQLAFTADSRAMEVKEYIYLGDDLVAIRERDANTNLFTFRYQHNDALGSALVETDANRNILTRTEYEPYGLTNRPTNDGPGYTGHVQDAATGLTYMQQRYYDPGIGRFLSVDPVTAYGSQDWRHFNRYAYAYNSPYKFTDPDGRCPQCLWGAPIGAGVNIVVQMATAKGSFSERFNQISWGQVVVATAAGALSGGVSAIASTATTTVGAIGANVVGNMAVGAVATHASAKVDGRTASVGEVAQGATLSGAASGLGAAIEVLPGAAARAGSAGMSQTQRTATANLLDGIKEATPGFKYANPAQTAANATGVAVSTSPDLKPLIEDKKK